VGRQTYEAHCMLVTCSPVLLGRSQVLLIICLSDSGIVDLSPGRYLNVCLRLLCLCCAVCEQVLYRADTLSKQSYHRRMHKMCKPARAAVVCCVIRTDSSYRHCPSQVAVTRRNIRRKSNSVNSSTLESDRPQHDGPLPLLSPGSILPPPSSYSAFITAKKYLEHVSVMLF
jgi:hypothetical protein